MDYIGQIHLAFIWLRLREHTTDSTDDNNHCKNMNYIILFYFII